MPKLAEAILDRRARSPNFFEGRLLTAEDLTADREAHFARQRLLGRAIGAGVVRGLWVERDATAPADAPRVTISAGEALSPLGDVLTLQNDLTLTLLVADQPAAAPDAGLFKVCAPPETEAVPTGDGFYMLTVSPESRFEEAAPMQSLTQNTTYPGCGKRWAVPGVAFRLVPFDPMNVPGQSESTVDSLAQLLTGSPGTAGLSRLRNIVAHLCFGSDELADFVADPFATEAGAPRLRDYGTVDYLRSLGVLDGCDLPLAVIYWTGQGIEFIDCWSVRRGPVASPLSDSWPSLPALRLCRENHARLLQFQDQLTRVIAEAAFPSTIVARDHFRFLPAAGLLPTATETRVGPTGETFFAAQPKREPVEYINGEQLRAALDRGWQLDPIDLDSDEMIWLYRPWQQDPARAAGRTDRAYLLFASPHMPPLNIPRFDVVRWDYANFPSSDL